MSKCISQDLSLINVMCLHFSSVSHLLANCAMLNVMLNFRLLFNFDSHRLYCLTLGSEVKRMCLEMEQ